MSVLLTDGGSGSGFKEDAATYTAADGSWTAHFTEGSRTVVFTGGIRTFTEPEAPTSVVTNEWVRLLPEPFAGEIDVEWTERVAHEPDILAIAMEYVEGAPDRTDPNGRRIAGDADYGPLRANGRREEGSDFNDFLQLEWQYGRHHDRPELRQAGSLDCSGFVRMVYGYRLGYPLSLRPDGRRMPRRAVMMEASLPGQRILERAPGEEVDFGQLRAGDLLFFDVSKDDSTDIDHVGIYLGQDERGDHRFLSSRKTMNGPTMADRGGRSVLNGTGFYARGFRAALRL